VEQGKKALSTAKNYIRDDSFLSQKLNISRYQDSGTLETISLSGIKTRLNKNMAFTEKLNAANLKNKLIICLLQQQQLGGCLTCFVAHKMNQIMC
jgi:hypothetical protein